MMRLNDRKVCNNKKLTVSLFLFYNVLWLLVQDERCGQIVVEKDLTRSNWIVLWHQASASKWEATVAVSTTTEWATVRIYWPQNIIFKQYFINYWLQVVTIRTVWRRQENATPATTVRSKSNVRGKLCGVEALCFKIGGSMQIIASKLADSVAKEHPHRVRTPVQFCFDFQNAKILIIYFSDSQSSRFRSEWIPRCWILHQLLLRFDKQRYQCTVVHRQHVNQQRLHCQIMLLLWRHLLRWRPIYR